MLKLFQMLKPYRVFISFVLVLVSIQTLSQLYLPTLMADIVDNGIVNGDIPYITKIGAFMLVVALITMVASILASFFSAKVAVGFGKVLRRRVFNHVENFSLHEFNQIGTSSLITRTTNDINQLQQVTIMLLRMLLAAPMMAIGGIIMAVSKDAKLSLVFVVAIPILILTISLIAIKGMPLFKALQKKLDHLNLVFREYLTGIRVIRSFNRENYEMKRYDKINNDFMDTATTVNKIMVSLMPIMMIILNFSTIAILWFGSIRISNGGMQVGDLMAFIQYGMQIMFSFIMVSIVFVMIPRAQVSSTRINEVLEMKFEIKDPIKQKNNKNKQGYIAFNHVNFSYPGAEQAAISDLTFDAKPGEVTAVLGGTGSGKSSLINLIPRFYDVTSGSILIDEVDIRDMSQADLRDKIGLTPQKATLFTGTVAENIRYGKQDASDEEVIHAATVAQANGFIESMEGSYNASITQGGSNVSGGQKQRLAIARTLVKRPEIYLFDDSFSALDFKTEATLRDALSQEVKKATVIIVAQRVATVMDADRIIVLNEGKTAGIGTHKELMSNCNVYREIVSSQLSEEEIA
ncbi:ABC transporter ATP-binding protein [Paraliobacillus zengyii]|uniref:ABC transporter ATP-binding protein n=1 Tax=Paraliobacillus zengyii TaxID=2213194 RepID=UPI000E3EB047|nr:ABC transporter ATP-binding protein [Paraliobacillus zengyii]